MWKANILEDLVFLHQAAAGDLCKLAQNQQELMCKFDNKVEWLEDEYLKKVFKLERGNNVLSEEVYVLDKKVKILGSFVYKKTKVKG